MTGTCPSRQTWPAGQCNSPGQCGKNWHPLLSMLCLRWSCQQEQENHADTLALSPLEQKREEGGHYFTAAATARRQHNDKIFILRVFLCSGCFGVFLFSCPKFVECSVLRFKRANICRTVKCSADGEVFRIGLSELDNLDPKDCFFSNVHGRFWFWREQKKTDRPPRPDK